VQNDKETVTRRYVVDYLSIANRDIFVTEDGSYTTRYVYDASGKRISAEFDYAPGTKRGEAGENLQSDIAVSIGKVFYRTSMLGSTLFAVDKDGNQIAHAIYDPWGMPLTETYTDSNYSGLENLNNFTGYTYDVTLNLYFAQNRFYDAFTHRFTQEDTAKDGTNWYVYCGNKPTIFVDWEGKQYSLAEGTIAHLTIEAYIAFNFPGSIIDKYVYGLKRTKSGAGRPDVVIKWNSTYQVYEIKSDQYLSLGRYASSAYNQLQSYIDAINNNRDQNIKNYNMDYPAVAGTMLNWDNHVILPYLLDKNKIIDAWTVAVQPGMIFYEIRDKNKKDELASTKFVTEELKEKVKKYEDKLQCMPPLENYVNVDTYFDLELNNDIMAWLDSIGQFIINDDIFVYTYLFVPGEKNLYKFIGIGPKELYINFPISRQKKMNALIGTSSDTGWYSQPKVDWQMVISMLGLLGGLASGGVTVPA